MYKMENYESFTDVDNYLSSLSYYDVGNLITFDSHKNFTKEKLAVIVPFRDAFDELEIFAPQMTHFLNTQGIPFHIFVIQQIDDWRFNRGLMFNAGYFYIKDNFSYMAMQDVDFVPLNPKVPYSHPGDVTLHLVPWYFRPECKVQKVRFNFDI